MRCPNIDKNHLDQGPQGKIPSQLKKYVAPSASGSSQLSLTNSLARKKLVFQSQQLKVVELGVKTNMGHKVKQWLLPGTLNAYLRMKTSMKETELREQRSKTILPQPVMQPKQKQATDHQMASSYVQLGTLQAHISEHVLENIYENIRSSDEYDLENDSEDDAGIAEIGDENFDEKLPEEQNDVLVNQPKGHELSAPLKRKRTRGPTVCRDVYEWTLDERRPIILNELGKPIGPNRKTLDKFSRFLGTLARNSTLAPLNKLSWRSIKDKDNIWSFVKTKFIISEEGKDYVLKSVGKLWRRYKCSVKAEHFSPYNDDKDRLLNAPDTIPYWHFKELLDYWNLDLVQEESNQKRESSIKQKDRHTMGPTSFARKKYELQQQDLEKKPHSQALAYKESRKRKEGNKYKTSYEHVQSNINKIEHEIEDGVDSQAMTNGERQSVKKRNKASVGGFIIPDEFLQPYKDQIVKDTVEEIMKMFKKELEPEIFANLTRSLGDVSSGVKHTTNNDQVEYSKKNDDDQDLNQDHREDQVDILE